MQWLLEHFQHTKQTLEAFNISNISVDEQSGTEYGPTSRMSADVLCLYLVSSFALTVTKALPHRVFFSIFALNLTKKGDYLYFVHI